MIGLFDSSVAVFLIIFNVWHCIAYAFTGEELELGLSDWELVNRRYSIPSLTLVISHSIAFLVCWRQQRSLPIFECIHKFLLAALKVTA